MWLLINNKTWKNLEMVKQNKRTLITQSGRALDLKTKDLIGHLWVSLIIDQSECLVCCLFLHWINSFLHCFKKKTALLLTNQNGEIFSCILLELKNVFLLHFLVLAAGSFSSSASNNNTESNDDALTVASTPTQKTRALPRIATVVILALVLGILLAIWHFHFMQQR